MNNENNTNNMNNFNNANNVVGQPVNNNNNNNNTNNKKGMISKILIGMLIGFLVCIGGIVVISLTTDIDNPDDYDNSNNYNDVDNANAKRLYIFKSGNYYYVEDTKEKRDGYEFVTEYICSSSNCNPRNGSSAVAVIVEDDNKYVIFDVENRKKISTPIEVDKNYALVSIANNIETKEVYGLVATSVDSYGYKNEDVNSKYYSVKYNKVIENENGILGVFKGKYMITYSRNSDRNGCVSTLIDVATEKTLSDKTLINQRYQATDNYLLLVDVYHLEYDFDLEFKVLDENLNLVSNKFYTDMIEKNNNIYLYNNTKDNNSKGYDVYNKTTKKLTNTNLNFDILDIIKDKVIVKGRNNYLTVLDMNGKVLKEITDVDLSKAEYDSRGSGYYKEQDGKKEGLYFMLYCDGNCFEYFFDNDTYETIRYDAYCN